MAELPQEIIKKIYQQGRADAIEEFINLVRTEEFQRKWVESDLRFGDFLAEQLKEKRE